MDTINVAYIVIAILNEKTTNDVGFWLNIITSPIGNGFYQDNESENYIKLTYYTSIEKYAVIIANSLDLYNHPWYPLNKVDDHLF